MDRLFRQVSVKDRLPEKEGKYHTNVGLVYFHGKEFYHWIDWWLEEITLESIQDKRELTATFLVNSIRLLDEQGARHLVNELCERFHLLPREEDLSTKVLFHNNTMYNDNNMQEACNNGIKMCYNYILNAIKK